MRTQIKVQNLTQRQWTWLQDNLMTGYEFAPFEPRACVEFGQAARSVVRHVEMPMPALVGLMMVLHSLGMIEQVQAEAEQVTKAAALPDEPRCDHGTAVVQETPSLFTGAQPVRDYADGCRSYGPYQQDQELPDDLAMWAEQYQHDQELPCCDQPFSGDEDDKNTRPEGADQ